MRRRRRPRRARPARAIRAPPALPESGRCTPNGSTRRAARIAASAISSRTSSRLLLRPRHLPSRRHRRPIAIKTACRTCATTAPTQRLPIPTFAAAFRSDNDRNGDVYRDRASQHLTKTGQMMNRLKTAAAALTLMIVAGSCASYDAYQKAKVAETEKNWDVAVQQYERGLELNPGSIQLRMSLA